MRLAPHTLPHQARIEIRAVMAPSGAQTISRRCEHAAPCCGRPVVRQHCTDCVVHTPEACRSCSCQTRRYAEGRTLPGALARLCRNAVQGPSPWDAGRVPVHAPVQPAWSTIGAVMSCSEVWSLTMPWHRLYRHAAAGSSPGGADRLPVHAPVQPAWSTIGAVMSWS